MRRFAPLALILSLAVPSLTPVCAAPALTPAAAAAESAREAAMEGYLYFYPLLTLDLARRQFTHPARGAQGAPANTFLHTRTLPRPGAATPWANPDMLRSSAWLDLTAGPVVLSVPDSQGRLYTLTLLDMWDEVFATLGPRSTGSARGHTAIVPPGWSGMLPSGLSRIDAPTAYVWARNLIQNDGPADTPAVQALQDGFTLTPLAQWNLPPQSQRIKADPFLDLKIPVREQVESMPTDAFFTYAATLLRRNPPHAADQPVLAKLRRVGLIPGRPFDFDKLDHPVKQGLRRGLREARERMRAAADARLQNLGGWQRETASVGLYGNAYLRRALSTQAQPGSGLPEDLTTLRLAVDSQNRPLDGAHRYVLHFANDQLPPADALWSLAAYDAQGMLRANPLDRYTLGDRDPLQYNADGSLDVIIGHATPAPEAQANWLPVAASGPIGVLLRAYGPGPALLDGLWTPPAAVRDEPEPEPEAETEPAPAAPAVPAAAAKTP